jgi:CubicO group peptidase (beta-lactamase class C family)
MRVLLYLLLIGVTLLVPPIARAAQQDPAVVQEAGGDIPRSGARLAAGQPIPPSELDALVDALVRQGMSAHQIAGAAVVVVQDDRVVLEKGYGWADVERQRPVDARTTLFRIGSIGKTFTWIALMNAVDEGRLGLDDPVNDHLPPELRISDRAFASPIRIRHLMTHTPGFEDRILGHLFVREPERVRPLRRYLAEERPARVREPGTVITYSNYGVGLAGAVLEHLHGQSWQDIIEQQILTPLGLSQTTGREPYPPRGDLPAPMPQALAERVSNGYWWTGLYHERRPFEHITQIAPAGAISASAGDMGRYMRMLLDDGALDGVRVFGEGAARAFRTPMTDLPEVVGNWAGGFWETRLPGGYRNYGHDGGTMLFFSSMVLVPELRLGIFATTNTAGGDSLSGPLPVRIVEHFYAPPGEPMSGSPVLEAARSVYEGHYLMTRRPYSGLEGFIFRLQTLRVRVTPDGLLALPFAGRAYRFVPADRPDLFQAVDVASYPVGGVLFRREGDRATQMEMLVMAFERVGPWFQPPTLAGVAALTLVIALGTLLGTRVRWGRGLPHTGPQQMAGWTQASAAIAWIASAVALAVFAAGAAGDVGGIVFEWPVWSIQIFSVFALAATVLSVFGAALLPAVWRPGDRPGWSRWRALRFTLSILAFLALGVLLALWGALWPW